jgi:hypothetical protein
MIFSLEMGLWSSTKTTPRDLTWGLWSSTRTTPKDFVPLRAKRSRFRIYLLDHSDIVSSVSIAAKKKLNSPMFIGGNMLQMDQKSLTSIVSGIVCG